MKLLAAVLVFTLLLVAPACAQAADGAASAGPSLPWWGWVLILFFFTLVLGIIAVLGGVGGGVLFVPIVSTVFPFHLDFVRGAGLMVALCGALSATPQLLRQGLASLRLALPLALMGSIGSVAGAMVGLALPDNVVKIMLGTAITLIVVLMTVARRAEFPEIAKQDTVALALGISGTYFEHTLDQPVDWKIHRTPLGLALFVVVGFLGGIFGLGAGWATVPTLNLVLGAPVKVAVATSGLIITMNGTAAAWVYLNSGAVIPLIAVPSVAGMMIGTRIGARLLSRAKPKLVRWIVIGILFVSGIRSLLSGLGV
jgi:uncharacterized protein